MPQTSSTSLRYSSLSPTEKKNSIEKLLVDWDKFISETLL